MPIVDELVTLLSFKSDTGDADKMKKTMSGLKDTIKSAGLALIALTGATGLFIKKAIGSVDANVRFAKSIGVTYRELQELEFAAESTGGSVDDLRSDLEGLATSMSSPIPGEFNNELVMLGINTHKTNGELKSSAAVLKELAKKMEGMTAVESMQWGKKLGLSKTTIELLRQGEKGIEKLVAEAHKMDAVNMFDPKQLAAAREFEKTWAQLKNTLVAFLQSAAIELAPMMREIIGEAKSWVKENKKLIKSNLKQFIKGVVLGFKNFLKIMVHLTPVAKMLGNWLKKLAQDEEKVKTISKIVAAILAGVLVMGIVSVIAKIVAFIRIAITLVKSLAFLKTGIMFVLGAFKTLAVFLLTNPIGIVIAVIIAIIGLFVMLKNKLGSAGAAFKMIGQSILKGFLLPVNLAMKGVLLLLKGINKIPGMRGKFTGLISSMARAQDKMNEMITGSSAINPLEHIVDTLVNPSVEDQAAFDAKMASAFKLSVPQTARISVPSSTNNNNQTSTEIKNTFHINGAQSPSATAAAVQGKISDSMGLQISQPGVQAPPFE